MTDPEGPSRVRLPFGMAAIPRARRSLTTCWIARTMPTYPVQRQRLPLIAMRMSCSVGASMRSTTSRAETTMPGVQ